MPINYIFGHNSPFKTVIGNAHRLIDRPIRACIQCTVTANTQNVHTNTKFYCQNALTKIEVRDKFLK